MILIPMIRYRCRQLQHGACPVCSLVHAVLIVDAVLYVRMAHAMWYERSKNWQTCRASGPTPFSLFALIMFCMASQTRLKSKTNKTQLRFAWALSNSLALAGPSLKNKIQVQISNITFRLEQILSAELESWDLIADVEVEVGRIYLI